MIWNTFCKKKNEIYRSFIAMIIYGAVICLGYASFGLGKMEPLTALLAAFVFIYVVCLFELTAIGKVILCAITVSFGAVKLILTGKEELTELMNDFACWVHDPVMDNEHFLLYIGAVIFLTAIFCYIIGIFCQKNKYVKYCIFYVGVIESVHLMIIQAEVPRAGIAFVFSFLMIVIVEWIEAKWIKNSDSSKRVLYMVCLWPVWGVFMVMMCFAPVSDKPFEWKFVRVINETVEDAVDTIATNLGISGRDDFSVGMSGFSENTKIGGDIENSNKVLLRVDADSKMDTNVYLTGIISDTFDGRVWKCRHEYGNSDRRLDTLETVYAVYKYDKEGMDDYVEKDSLKITYKDFSSHYYFIPGKCSLMKVDGININSSVGDKNKQWKKRKREGDEYITEYYQLNLDHEIFYEMIESPQYDDEKVWNEVCLNEVYEHVDLSALKEYQNRQKEQYTEDVELSAELQQWVEEITHGCTSDLERLCAIEKAMGEFRYTKHPGEIPSDVDTPSEFLDYLIFEKQEGYCTYFATAFTLLARSQGLPARFVEGFSIPIKEYKAVSVTADMTHAWPEVYFEGTGWIPFEPTPGYSSVRYTPWKVKGESEETTGESRQIKGYTHEPTEIIRDEVVPVGEEDTRQSIDTYAAILGILIALFLVIIIVSADIIICRFSYRKKDMNSRYMWEIERAKSVLARLGITKKEDETLSDLRRIMEEKYRLWDEETPEFISEYECVLYGTRPVTKEMVDNVIMQRTKMKKRLKPHMRLIEEFKDYRKK